MPLYKIKNGTMTKISSREAKATIMKAHGWTDEQYRKEYDKFKLKLRSYETIRKEQGKPVAVQSPQELLYKQAKSMEKARKQGYEYKPSAQMRNIQLVPAYSYSKSKEVSKSPERLNRLDKRVRTNVETDFEALIKANSVAQGIVDNAKSGFEMLDALTAFAKDLHAFQKGKPLPSGGSISIDGKDYPVDDGIEYPVDDFSIAPFPEADYMGEGGGSDPTDFPLSWQSYLV